MNFVITILVVFVVLVTSEIWWRRRKIHSEVSRKAVHISVGSFVAFWPYFLSWDEIKLLSVAFLIVVFLSKYLSVFQAIHSVQRPTWGEVFFAIAVGAIAFVTNDRLIYMTALLLMSLADGLAAVIGVRYGINNRYKIFSQAKSVIGTATFFCIALAILYMYMRYAHIQTMQPALLAIALFATVVENLAVAGLDNLLVPLSAAILLTHIH